MISVVDGQDDGDLDRRLSDLEAAAGIAGGTDVRTWVERYLQSAEGFRFDYADDRADGEQVCIYRDADGFGFAIPEADVPAWIDVDADLPVGAGGQRG